MKSESEVQQEIRLTSPKYKVSLLRNNQGAFKDETGRLVRFGLGNESPNQAYRSSDLIGFIEVTVTPEMVGKSIAVFTAVEVKKENWKPSNDQRELFQRNFIEWVKSKGGIAGMVKSVDEFIALITR